MKIRKLLKGKGFKKKGKKKKLKREIRNVPTFLIDSVITL